MRILHVHTRYRQLGGEDRVVDAERAVLSASGHEVVPYDAENAPSDIAAAAQLLASPWNLRAAMRIRETVRESQPDIAHVHNTWFASSPSVIRAIKNEGVPVAVTLHNYRMTCVAATLSREGSACELCVGNSGWAGLRYRCYRGSVVGSMAGTATNVMARRSAYEHVTRFIALTDFARGIYVRAGLDPGRISVVPNFTADPGPRPTPPSHSDTALFVGRLSPEKGIEQLLQAWTRAQPELRLQVIGDGPLADLLRQRYPAVEFLGLTPGDEVVARMLSVRALLFPSQWYEGQSLVVLEAMAAGLPVLASDWPPIRDTLTGEDDGWFRPAGDPGAWCDGLGILADDAAVDSASRIVRSRYLMQHTPEAAQQRLEDVYRATAQGAGA